MIYGLAVIASVARLNICQILMRSLVVTCNLSFLQEQINSTHVVLKSLSIVSQKSYTHTLHQSHNCCCCQILAPLCCYCILYSINVHSSQGGRDATNCIRPICTIIILWHDAVTGYFESLITNFDRVQTTNKTCENTLIYSATLTVLPFFDILQLFFKQGSNLKSKVKIKITVLFSLPFFFQ